MAKRKIRLLGGSFHSYTTTPKKGKVWLVKYRITSKFDQIVADQMGIKDLIYDPENPPAMRQGWDKLRIDIMELFGATIVVNAVQTDLFGKGKGGLTFESVKVDGFEILKQKADNGLKLSFDITTAGVFREVQNFLDVVGTEEVTIAIEPANALKVQDSRNQAEELGLFKAPKEAGSDEDDDDEGSEGDEDEEEEGAEDKAAGSLASARVVMGPKKKRLAERAN